MACTLICPKHCIKVIDSLNAMNAEIDESVCINCRLCEKVCPNVTKAETKTQIEWKQGWA